MSRESAREIDVAEYASPPAGDLAGLARSLRDLLGSERLLDDEAELRFYEYDASMERAAPHLVAIPRSVEDLSAIVQLATEHRTPFVARGAGTGYSGGALPICGGLVILTRDLNRIVEVNAEERWIRCEPGVVLEDLTRAAQAFGLRYLPDPSSHRVCTVGGNVAENAGGPHALGFGPTSNFVISAEVLLPNGELTVFHENDVYGGSLDIRSLFVGSEGTLGIVTQVQLRLVSQPEIQRIVFATFPSADSAVEGVERVLGAGLSPTALDMLTGAYLPNSAGDDIDPSILFIDVEGRSEDVEGQVSSICKIVAALGGRFDILSVDAFLKTRADLVRDKVRAMVASTGLPRYYLFDCVAPRSRLRALMAALRDAADRHDLPLLNTFHAGDGNVHPAPFYDPRDSTASGRLEAFLRDVLQSCADLGGSISGEHGIGLEKRNLMPLVHTDNEIAAMRRIKFGFDPANLCNPGKILPETQSGGRPQEHLDSREVVLDEASATVAVNSESVTFGDIEKVLEETPFRLSYEPLGAALSSSVLRAIDGGVPSAREGYGLRARDLVVSATVGSNGDLRTGGQCAKDVSGYELRKLAYGGRGRLGNLMSVTVRLVARPTDSWAATVQCTSPSVVLDLARDLHLSTLPLASLVAWGNAGSSYLSVLLEASGGSVGAATDQFTEMSAAHGARRVNAADIADRFSRTVATVLSPAGFRPGSAWAAGSDRSDIGGHPGSFVSLPATGLTWTDSQNAKQLSDSGWTSMVSKAVVGR